MVGDETYEKDKEHAFKTLRFFPELHQSVRTVDNVRDITGRCFKPSTPSVPRTIQMKSTHGLEVLTTTALGEINALSSFRKAMVEDRRKMREAEKRKNNPAVTVSKDASKSDPMSSAKEKLTKASLSFDSRSIVNVLAAFFKYKEFTASELNAQLRRSLNIYLTKGELEALCSLFTPTANNTYESVEFTRYFFKLGNDAREFKRLHARRKEEEVAAAKHQLEREATMKNLLCSSSDDLGSMISGDQGASETDNYNEGDDNAEVGVRMVQSNSKGSSQRDEALNAVLMKLSATSNTWDNSFFIESVCTAGFEAYLTPLEFKEQIDKSFKLKLSAAEVNLLVDRYRVIRKSAGVTDYGVHTARQTDLMMANPYITRQYHRNPASAKKSSGGSNSNSKLRTAGAAAVMRSGSAHANGTSGPAGSSGLPTPPDVNKGAAAPPLGGAGRSSYRLVDNYCIDGHRFLKDFLSGDTIKKPAQELINKRTEVLAERKRRMSSMATTIDCLPKTLGR